MRCSSFMKTMYLSPILTVALGCAACDGPQEKAGAAKDEQAAKAAGQIYEGNGPSERAGAAQDRINRAETKARASQADALKDQGGALRAKADADAEKLEHQADEIRAAAKAQADALKKQADEINSQARD